MKPLSRTEVVNKTKQRLLRDGYPRLQMFLIVCLTGAVGFITSYMLLDAGMTAMWLRYGVAMMVAYLAFMGLLWIWLHSKSSDYSDFPDLTNIGNPIETGGKVFQGQGGNFGGAGANASFEPISGEPLASSSSSMPDVGLADIAEEELAIPIFVILIVTALLTLSAWIVYSAPILFAELMVDGVLSVTLYKHLKKSDSGHWLETAFRHTSTQFFIAMALVVGMGWGLHVYTPSAHTLGQAIENHQRLDQ